MYYSYYTEPLFVKPAGIERFCFETFSLSTLYSTPLNHVSFLMKEWKNKANDDGLKRLVKEIKEVAQSFLDLRSSG